MSPTAKSQEKALELMTRLQRHPQLYEQMSALLDEVENRAGALNTGDEAEDAIVQPFVRSNLWRIAPRRRKVPLWIP